VSDHPTEVVPETERFPRAIFAILFIFALCLHFMGMMIHQQYVVPLNVGGDAGLIAHNLADGFGFSLPTDVPPYAAPTTSHAPAYPGFLALLLKFGLTDAQLYYRAIFLNLFFCALLPPIVLAIGQDARFPRPVSLLAAIAICFCPAAFRAVGSVSNEAVFVTLSALLLAFMLARLAKSALPGLRTSAAFGAASGLLALLNPAMLLALPAGWLAALFARRVAKKQLAIHAVLFLGTTLLASSPWHIRNWLLLKPPAPVFICQSQWLTTWSTLLAPGGSQSIWRWLLISQVAPALLGIIGLFTARRRIAKPVQAFLWCALAAYLLPFNITEPTLSPLQSLDPIFYLGCAWLLWVLLRRREHDY